MLLVKCIAAVFAALSVVHVTPGFPKVFGGGKEELVEEKVKCEYALRDSTAREARCRAVLDSARPLLRRCERIATAEGTLKELIPGTQELIDAQKESEGGFHLWPPKE